jgi:hypothetical protein
MLHALQGNGPSHDHDGQGEACLSEVIFRLAVALSGASDMK